MCSIHGEGAERVFKPAASTRRGRGGRIIRVVRKEEGKMKKEFYWRCKLGPRGGVLRQTTLSFMKKAPEYDHPRRIENATKSTLTSSEGQGASPDV